MSMMVHFSGRNHYPFIDYLYEVWGIENVWIRAQDHSVYLLVKAEERPIHQDSFTIKQLQPFIQESMIEKEENQLILLSAYRKTSLELPIKMLDIVKNLAEQANITMSQWVERTIVETLKKENN